MASAFSWSISRSSPKIPMPRAARTPESSSLNRNSIGWLKLNNVPGISRSQTSADPVDELVLRADLVPSLGLVQQDPGVGQIHASRLQADLGPADPADHRADLGRELPAEGGLEARRVGYRLIQRAARGLHLGNDEISLVELGDELPPRPSATGTHAANPARAPRLTTHRVPQRRSQDRLVHPLGPAHREGFVLGSPRLEEERGEDGRGRQGEQQRAGQREDDRQRHRPEHLALDPLQRQDRQVDHRDDRHAKDDWPPHLQCRAADYVERALIRAGVRQAADAVLDHDHRTVDDQAEVDRAEAHQAAGDAEGEHQVAGEEHRQWDRQRHDQARAEVAQEEQQDRDDQHAPLGQVVSHRVDRLLDQVASVVVRSR